MFRKEIQKSEQNQNKSAKLDFPATVFGFYWSVVRRFPLFYSVVGIAIISGFLLDRVMFPYTNKWAVQIFESAAQGAWNEKLLWIAGLYLAIFAIGAVRQYMNLHWRPIVARYTSFALYKRVYKNDTDFFISRPAGQVTSQISAVAGNLNKMTLEFYTDVINFSVGMLLLSVGIFLENFWFAVVIAIGAVLRTGWRFIWQRKINAQQKILQDISSRISGMRTDSLGNAMTAKLFGNVEYENKYIWNQQAEQIKIEHKIGRLRIIQDRPAMALWFGISFALVLMCWVFIKDGTMALADGMFVFVAGRSIASHFDSLVSVLVTYSENKAKSVHAYDDIIQPCSIVDARGQRI